MAESDIKRDIMEYLNGLPGAYFRVIQIKGIKGRKSPSRGVPDILGVYFGRAVAIEVKTATGKLEESQIDFIENWTKRGRGVAIIARSVQDVIDSLNELRVY